MSSVIVKPFKRNLIPEAPITMHGAPATMHVTSPTSSLSSERVSVVEIVPLMSLALARVPQTKSANIDKLSSDTRLTEIWFIGAPYAVKVARGHRGRYGVQCQRA